MEIQRDEALQNLTEAQDSLDDYQRRMKDKIRKMEDMEDQLRETLTSTAQERDNLLEDLSDMQSSLASQGSQINRLLYDLENEESKNRDADEDKKKYQEQIELLTAQLLKYESDTKSLRTAWKEKETLEAELADHKQTLAKELTDILSMAKQYHQTAAMQDDSGNCSTHNPRNEGKAWPVETAELVATLNTNNNGLAELNSNNDELVELNTNNNGLGCEGGTTMMGELRNLFTNMDGEIQRLRYDLKQRDADDKTYQNLHDELRVLMDKVESGVRSNQELECLVSSLEEDKRNLLIKLDDCHQKVAERERQIHCMDTRLTERNHQVVCLQEDNNDKAQTICQLTKQLECCEQRLSQTECGQNDCLEQLQAMEARVKELEDILCQKEKTIHQLSEQIVKLNKDFRCMQQKYEKKVECLSQQIYELQKQVEQLSSENDTLSHKLAACLKASEDCKRSLHQELERSQCLESQLEELRMTMEDKENLHCKILESLQQKICKNNEQIKCLEANLAMCKNEVRMYLELMEKLKNQFDCEITKREQCIKHLKEELRKCSEDLKCRTQENCSLEQTNADLHNKLANAYAQLKTMEQNICCLTDKLKNLENIMLKDKNCYMKETEELERRLSQALNNLQCAHEEINKLKAAIAEKSGMIDCLQGEKNSLCRDLTKCKEVACNLQDKLNKKNQDNEELCRQLQQKMECIREMEAALCSKEQEVKCCQRMVEELQEKIKHLYTELTSSGGCVQSLQDKLKCCREELLCATKNYNETEDALKRCELDIRDKCEQIRLLNCTIEEINCRLHERIARIDELERSMENLTRDCEKRLKRADDQLKKYECELCEKSKQIADLDDCLSRCQHNLNEKSNEACLLEQKNTRLCSDLNNCNDKLKESEEARECLGKALSEQRGETAELSQDLRITREHLQQKHQELLDCQQNLCSLNREWDKCRQDCDDLRSALTQRDSELLHLNEEKNCLVSKVAHLTCRLENETCQLQNQLTETKCRFEKENESLRIYQAELEENISCLVQKLGAYQRQLSQMEKNCYQKVDSMTRELEDLASKLADREDQITQCKECINLRNSEIMRLKLQLCNVDSCCTGNRSCNNNNNHNQPQPDLQLDPLESPTLVSSFQPLRLSPTCQSPAPHPAPVNTSQTTVTQDITGKIQRQEGREVMTVFSHSVDSSLLEPSKSSIKDSSLESSQSSIRLSDIHERLYCNQMLKREIEEDLNQLERQPIVMPPV